MSLVIILTKSLDPQSIVLMSLLRRYENAEGLAGIQVFERSMQARYQENYFLFLLKDKVKVFFTM
jgi:hypothetical protein